MPEEVDALRIKVMGNPTETYFMTVPESNNDHPIDMKVVDLNGKILEIRRDIRRREMIRFGEMYTVGTYFAEFIQGKQRKVVKLIKQ